MWKIVLIAVIFIQNSLQTENFSITKQNHIFKDDSGIFKDSSYFIDVQRGDNIKRYRLKDNSHERFIDKSLVNYCQRPAKCQQLNYTSCMDTKLPYFSSTLNLTRVTNQEEVQMNLQLYNFARFVPMCWPVIQPFLCAWFMPRCENDTVYLPSKVMCKSTLKPCKIFYELIDLYPNCDDESLFPPACKNDILELKFNNTELCMEPLVKTDQVDSFHPDIEGCGLSCKDAYYTNNEHKQIHKLVGYCVLICIILTLFTVITFLIDWKTANKYPALAIFYVNICFLVSYSGWMIQFLGTETREDIVCKKDGTLRKSEPSATENLSCVIVFVMVYYFLIAGLVWFVIFTYCWHMSSLQALGNNTNFV
ncbi:frizzled [Holotrichia oblita]|uniref:Frizzled n=1 Tax=Holotrichia oblita TaxID=644536 RepID=A0ACB9SMT4_HOLOL|nr:frizzled [Holotrichia oblita]